MVAAAPSADAVAPSDAPTASFLVVNSFPVTVAVATAARAPAPGPVAAVATVAVVEDIAPFPTDRVSAPTPPVNAPAAPEMID